MNFQISSPAISTTWEQNKLHFVGLAAGLALAISAAAALSGSFSGQDTPTVGADRAVSIPAGPMAPPEPAFFYLVDSEEQAKLISQSLQLGASEALATGTTAHFVEPVIVLTGDERIYNHAHAEIAEAANKGAFPGGVQILDLTRWGAPTARP